jgi:radical SAM protein with 4Fe4S-binding SPASM domain
MNLPNEVAIEIESRCNFNCSFCFNKNSFAKKGRKKTILSRSYLEKIIDEVWLSGIATVRFTGGEPLLRDDIFDVCAYAKKRGLYVKLNTNASLINKENVEKISKNVDDILISLRGSDEKRESESACFPQVLEKKIQAIKLLKNSGIKNIRIATIITKESVRDFRNISKLIASLPINEWGWYRPVTNSNEKIKSIDNDLVEKVVRKIKMFKSMNEINVHIGNSIPFCAIKNHRDLQCLSYQASFDEGYNRLIIDPRGFVKPYYFSQKNIGDPLDLLGAWNSQFMKKIRNLEYLPKRCVKCALKEKCRGGSRYEAKVFTGKYNGNDFLADYKNI